MSWCISCWLQYHNINYNNFKHKYNSNWLWLYCPVCWCWGWTGNWELLCSGVLLLHLCCCLPCGLSSGNCLLSSHGGLYQRWNMLFPCGSVLLLIHMCRYLMFNSIFFPLWKTYCIFQSLLKIYLFFYLLY